MKFKEQKVDHAVRLDLGAGNGLTTPEGFIPVDITPGKGITVVDLRKKWPWKSNSVGEVRCHCLIHYLTPVDRVHFVNELYRVLKPGAQAQIVTPYWCANRAYLDLSVQWPPVVEGWFAALSKSWREAQTSVDPNGYACDFDHTLSYGMHPMIVVKNQEYQHHAVAFYKEAAQELIATLTKLE